MLSLARLLVVLTAILPFACSAADAPAFELGKDFKALAAPQATADPSKVEVMEVFAYSCPHCYVFDPVLRPWLARQKPDVNFVRLPHTLGQEANIVRNKAFYAAQMLGVSGKFHTVLFSGVHQDHKPLATQDELRDMFAQSLGVQAKDFDGAFSSFAVDAGFRRGEAAVRDMAIASVPTLVIEGRYYVNPGNGGFAQMLAVADYLIDQARATKPKVAAAPATPAAPAAKPKKKKARAPAAPKTP